jgi:hypothetical protein
MFCKSTAIQERAINIHALLSHINPLFKKKNRRPSRQIFLSFNCIQCGHQSRHYKRRQYLANSTPYPRQHFYKHRSNTADSRRKSGRDPALPLYDVFDTSPEEEYRSMDQQIVQSSEYNGTKMGWCTILLEIRQLTLTTICGNTKFSSMSR